jgi:acyl-CoA dehydrogenase
LRRRSVLFGAEHEMFRNTVSRFVQETLAPGNAQWEKEGRVPREVWRQAGSLGLLCSSLSSRYGGADGDFLHEVTLVEELARAGMAGPLAGFLVHSNVVAPYLSGFGSEAQKLRWLPRMVSGEVIAALALTEPDAGSDLRGIKTRASRDGESYVISGQKTYISNGQNCDLIVLAAKLEGTPADAVTLFLVDATSSGFTRGKNLEKIGLKSQDTSELFFDEVRVSPDGLLGEPGRGMQYLSVNLAVERLVQAIRSAAVAEAVIGWTVEYTMERKAFGKRLSEFQNTQFKLAELEADTRLLRAYVDDCIAAFMQGALSSVDAAIAKLKATEIHCRAVDECLQLHGGWGYIWETPIARAYADARVAKIAAGSVEVMKVIIARALFSQK